jgi:hypothetical protein
MSGLPFGGPRIFRDGSSSTRSSASAQAKNECKTEITVARRRALVPPLLGENGPKIARRQIAEAELRARISERPKDPPARIHGSLRRVPLKPTRRSA